MAIKPKTVPMTSTSFEKVCVREEDAIRLIIEFLSRRDLCISQLSLEREAGVYNCNYHDDLIFLRQLILDGQWDDALQFVSPLEKLETFSSQQFRFIIYKHKYVELLCIRAEASAPSQTVVEVAVQDIIACLTQLDNCCPVDSREEYNRLHELLTVQQLTDEEELKNWNPNSWRLKCFHDVVPLVEKFMQPPCPASANDSTRQIAKNDRLMNLIFKGLMYEVCLSSVESKLSSPSVGPRQADKYIDPDVMNGIQSTFNLYSFLQSVPQSILEAYMGSNRKCDEPMNLDIEKHDKPLLLASWSEMILSTPIKPNVFPHMNVPYTRIKTSDLMSKSLSTSLMKSANAKDLMTMSVYDIAHFSRSTLAATGFHLTNASEENKENNHKGELNNCDSLMSTSVDRLFKGPDVFSTSKCLPSETCDFSKMPTITELATPTSPLVEAAFKMAEVGSLIETPRHDTQESTSYMGDCAMNESFLDIWKNQHQQKNKLIRTMADKRASLPLSSAKGQPLRRKHSASSSSSYSAGRPTSSIMRERGLPESECNSSASSTTGDVSTDRAVNHFAHPSSRFTDGTPANTSVAMELAARTPMTSTPKANAPPANSIKRELFNTSHGGDQSTVLWSSPACQQPNDMRPYGSISSVASNDRSNNKVCLPTTLSATPRCCIH